VRYDVVVIGAGPSGSTAARVAAEGGASVLLLEKHDQVGVPVCCAEAINLASLRLNTRPRPSWVAARADAWLLVAPDGSEAFIRQPEAGVVLERRVFDRDLAAFAVGAGAELWTSSIAVGLEFDGDSATGVRVRRPDGEVEVECEVVIGADGLESRVARWAGMRSPIPLSDLDVCAQYLMSGVNLRGPGVMEFHIGRDVAPGGYAWVFPKGGDRANIGLGVSPLKTNGRTAFNFLDDFVARRCPDARTVEATCGNIALYDPKASVVRGNVLLVGDAGRLLDSLSGGGLDNSLVSGRLAGSAAAAYVSSTDKAHKHLDGYARELKRVLGKGLKHQLFLSNIAVRMSDDELSRVVRFIPELFPGGETTMIDVPKAFGAILRRHPGLLLLARRVVF
jgi:digeranylgeranylglycerophospholipid reductase